jgi:hypothetical protein
MQIKTSQRIPTSQELACSDRKRDTLAMSEPEHQPSSRDWTAHGRSSFARGPSIDCEQVGFTGKQGSCLSTVVRNHFSNTCFRAPNDALSRDGASAELRLGHDDLNSDYDPSKNPNGARRRLQGVC